MTDEMKAKIAWFHTLDLMLTMDSNLPGNEKYKSAHNIPNNEVWSEDIPVVFTQEEAIALDGDIVKAIGTVSNPVFLFPLGGSNYQTWFYDENPIELSWGLFPSANYIKGYINPNDKISSSLNNGTFATSYGYTVKLYRPNGVTEIGSSVGTWNFEHTSGFLQFDYGYTPVDDPNYIGIDFDSTAYEASDDKIDYCKDSVTGGPRMIAFQYVGDTLGDSLVGINQSIDDLMGATGATGPGALKISIRDVLKDYNNQEGIYVSGDNGTKPFYTNNSVFEDKAYPLVGKKLTSNQGTVDYDWDEMMVLFSRNGDMDDVNDLVGVNSEMPHQAKTDGKIYPHIHWVQTSNDNIVFELDYRVQSNNAEKTTAWTRMVADVEVDSAFTYNSGSLNQITRFKTAGVPYIDMTGASISSTIQFKLTRTDAVDIVVEAMFFDFHFEISDLGSRDEFVK